MKPNGKTVPLTNGSSGDGDGGGSSSVKRSSNRQRRSCTELSKTKIDNALELLEKNGKSLKYVSNKTGISIDSLKKQADLKQIKYNNNQKNNDNQDEEEEEEGDNSDNNNNVNSDETADDEAEETNGSSKSSQPTDYESDEEVEEKIDQPRKLTARKSTSPLKFYLKSFKIASNQRSSLSTCSKSSETSNSTQSSSSNNNNRLKQNNKQSSSHNDHVANGFDLKTIPLTNKIIDYTIIGANDEFSSLEAHNFLQNKSKLIEEIEKTVKIYAYLGLRQRYHPIFLIRNLSYMHNNPNKKRQKSNILTNVSDKKKKKLIDLINTTKRTKLESILDRITNQTNYKEPTIQQPMKLKYELKFNFNYFQINNQNFIRNVLLVNKKLAKSCNIEIYGISSENNVPPNLIGKCKCQLKIENNSTIMLDNNNSKINFKIQPTTYYKYLLRIYFKNKISLIAQTVQQPTVPVVVSGSTNPKKRKKPLALRKTAFNSKKSRTNGFMSSKKNINNDTNDSSFKFQEFFVVFSLQLPNLQQQQKETNDNLKDIFFKQTTRLELNKKDEFNLMVKQIIYKKEKIKLNNYLNKFQQDDEDVNDDDDDDDEDDDSDICDDDQPILERPRASKSSKIKPNDFGSSLNQYLIQNESFIINFKVETSYNDEEDDDIIVLSASNSPKLKKTNSSNSSFEKQPNDKPRSSRNAKSKPIPAQLPPPPIKNKQNKQIQIFYQFIKSEASNNNNNNSNTNNNNKSNGSKSTKFNNSNLNNKLLTQKFDMICPFCQLDCKQLKYLCFHLQMFHFRFLIEEQQVNNTNGTTTTTTTNNSTNFLSQSISNNNYLACSNKDYYSNETKMKITAQFNIRLDENFNGSYQGNPYDTHYAAHLGFSLSRQKPTKRNQVSFVLVNKKSNIFDLSQFKDLTQEEFSVLNIIQQQQQQLNCQMQPNQMYNCQAGIERMYFHTQTGLPIHVNEFNYDSDDELDPDWLKEQTNLLIDEFDDVNEGEKDMMRLWNLHSIKFNYVPDCQYYYLCETFINEQTESIMKKNLFNNFILHLTNALDYGLLTSEEMFKLNNLLHLKKDEIQLQIDNLNKSNFNNNKSPFHHKIKK